MTVINQTHKKAEQKSANAPKPAADSAKGSLHAGSNNNRPDAEDIIMEVIGKIKTPIMLSILKNIIMNSKNNNNMKLFAILTFVLFTQISFACKESRVKIQNQSEKFETQKKIIDVLNTDLNNDGEFDKVFVEQDEWGKREIIVSINNGTQFDTIAKNNFIIGCATCGNQSGDPFINLQPAASGFDISLEDAIYSFSYLKGEIVLNKIDFLILNKTTEGIEEKHLIFSTKDFGLIKLSNFTNEFVTKLINSKSESSNNQSNKKLGESYQTLPYDNKIDLNNVNYEEINSSEIKSLEEFSCGEINVRYLPLFKKGSVDAILVPQDCGDFPYRFLLLTIIDNMVKDNLYVEGEWFEPEDKENTLEVTNFKVDTNYLIYVNTNGKIELYKIDDNGMFIKEK